MSEHTHTLTTGSTRTASLIKFYATLWGRFGARQIESGASYTLRVTYTQTPSESMRVFIYAYSQRLLRWCGGIVLGGRMSH